MKKSMLTAVCAAALILGAVQVQAQQNPAMPQRPMSQAQNNGGLFEQLNLTTEQQEAYQKIKDTTRDKMAEVRKEMKVYLDKIEALRVEEQNEFEKILTPEQKNIFDQYKAERTAQEEANKARIEEMRKRYEAQRAAKK